MTDRTMISIIVPCYNEQETLPMLQGVLERLIATLEKSYAVEILFVDDGSKDGTYPALLEVAPRVRGRVLKHEVNRGIAEAFRTGFTNAKGDIICTIDADCTFDPLELPEMIAKLESTGADIIAASQHHPQGGVEGVPHWRVVVSRGATYFYRYLLPVKLYSYTGCFRVFRRDAARRLQFDDSGFLGVTEMLVSGILQGMKIVEWPTVLKQRATGVSKMRTLQVTGDHVRFMIRLARGDVH